MKVEVRRADQFVPIHSFDNIRHVEEVIDWQGKHITLRRDAPMDYYRVSPSNYMVVYPDDPEPEEKARYQSLTCGKCGALMVVKEQP